MFNDTPQLVIGHSLTHRLSESVHNVKIFSMVS
jgi:hypothetical protein